MSSQRRLPEPTFPAVPLQQWEDAAAGGPDRSKLQSTTPDGLRAQALYPTPFDGPRATVPRASTAPWRIGLAYDLDTPAAVGEAIALDAEYGLDVAWVKLDGAQRCGGALGREGGVRFGGLDDLRKLSTAARDCLVWLQAGVGSDELEETWAKLGVEGGPLYDPHGPLVESGGLGVELDVALSSALRGVGRRPRSLLVDGALFHDRGATATQELGLAFAAVLELLGTAGSTQRSVARTLDSIVLRLAMDSDAFTSVAKARAARWIIAGLAQQAGADGGGAYVCGRTARRNRTRRDPWVNMLRSTVEAFAGAVGGVDEMLIDAHSAALGEPRSDARRWALGTGLLLREESHLSHVVDPAAGSGYVESLTQQLAEGGWRLATEIASSGGLAKHLLDGKVQTSLEEAASARVTNVHTGREALTGLSLFPNLDEPDIDVGPATQRKGALGIAPTVVAQRVEPLRLGSAFEQLRDASDQHRETTGHRPVALLVLAEPLFPARADFARSVLAVGGFEVRQMLASELSDFGQDVPRVAVLSATDEVLSEQAAALIGRLRSAGVRHVAVAGRPKALGDAAEHVDGFLHLRSDVPQVMAELQRAAGVEL